MQLAKKFFAAFCALSLAVTAALPYNGNSFVGVTAVAAASESSTGKTTYDFRDGSVIPTNTGGNTDKTSDDGKLTVKVGTKNTYSYNGTQHGVAFNEGNSIEIKVDGPTKLTVGDCRYNNVTELTVKNTDDSWSETQTVKTECYNNGDNAAVFTYDRESATTLIIEFTDTVYIPVIITEPITGSVTEPVVDNEPHTYDFRDGSIISGDTDKTNNVTSGNLTAKANTFRYNDATHGVEFKAGSSIEIKVGGSTKVTVGDCQYSAATKLTVKSSDGSYTQTESVGSACYPNAAEFEYTGSDPTTLILELDDKAYIPIIITEPIEVPKEPDPSVPPETIGNGKADVWDFGAEELDTELYNNKLTVDIINGFYPEGTVAGSDNVTIGSFATPDGELLFEANGKTNNRIRTDNKNITRYDSKNITIDGTALKGMIYSNSGATKDVYLGIKLYANDILTLYMSSNGGASTINCESPSGDIQEGQSSGSGAKLTFYAPEDGIYKIYSIDEKLTVWRAIREHTTPVKVSGTIDTSAAEGIADYKLCFTNTSTDKATEVAPKDGAYTVYLYDSYTYEMSLVDANGYIIKDNAPLKIAKGSSDVTKDIDIIRVDLATVTGKITGLSADVLAKLKLSFVNDKYAYVPEFTISGSNITVQLEKDVEYKIVAEGINDYELSSVKTIKAAEDGTQDIAFALKPTYDITVTLTDLPESAKSSAGLTFTNLNEEGYTYKFAAGETPKLRDGSYSVKVTGTGSAAYVQKVTSNLNVDGAAVSKTIGFEPIEEWDFAKYNYNPGIETIGNNKYYLGLELSAGNVLENKTYLLLNKDGEINIPVKKGQTVTFECCYQAAFEVEGKQVFGASGSTTKFETAQAIASADGFMTVKGIEGTTEDGKSAKQTYLTKISVKTAAEYKAKLTVGADKDYQTINDALAAAAQMSRPNNERVEIVIDPGNYEEMLVINIPNVSLINAAGKNSSLEITNKGVDIGENVVRITSYYGHGYNYYSMGSDCKWNAEVLAANKSNGYISTTNPGSGTTNGSYWNSTVVVMGSGFEADGIVFENSFNQYISKKEAADTVVMWETGSKGQRPTTAGDTSVQQRKFVERAAAVSIVGDKSVFNNCKFIGRQDTLYGGQNIKAVFQKCDILGAVDYIFGGMTAVFYQCNLVMNTDADKNDQAYLTAAQQASGRGYLMYNCTVTSTTPGVDTASETRSKPGYFGRPWQANTSEVVFYNTIIETSDYPGSEGKSLIEPEGWKNSLGGESSKMYEYGTTEKSKEDNSASRAEWATLLDTPYIDGGETEITIKAFLGDWTDELNERDLVLELSKTPEKPDDPEDPETSEEPTEFEDNDIEVTVPADAFDDADEITFNADPVDDETDDNMFTFDLSFTDKDGNKVQPNVAVTVKIPVPTALKGKTIYVYHVEDNGTYTQIDCKVEYGMVVFTASRFSKYIVTSEKLTASGETPSTPGTSDESTSSIPSEGTSSTPSGDTSSAPGESEPSTSNPSTGVGAGMTFAFAALAGGIVIVTKKKR